MKNRPLLCHGALAALICLTTPFSAALAARTTSAITRSQSAVDGACVVLQAGGHIIVAIISKGRFLDAAALIVPFALKFGHREANIIGTPSVKDIDRDGDGDLQVKFVIEKNGILCRELNASLLFGKPSASAPSWALIPSSPSNADVGRFGIETRDIR